MNEEPGLTSQDKSQTLNPTVPLLCYKAMLHHISAYRNFLTVDPSGPVRKSQLCKLQTAAMVSFFKTSDLKTTKRYFKRIVNNGNI